MCIKKLTLILHLNLYKVLHENFTRKKKGHKSVYHCGKFKSNKISTFSSMLAESSLALYVLYNAENKTSSYQLQLKINVTFSCQFY
jgi:hypothetical protein